VKINTTKKTILAFTLIFAALLISTATVVDAQSPYPTEATTTINVDASGLFTTTVPDLGVTYNIYGTPGATGTVTTSLHNGNPYATAQTPDNVTLTKFITVAFDFPSKDFAQATLTFSFSDTDIAGLQEPYAIYKYDEASGTYIELDSIVDMNAKTMTVILSSTTDPTFAIGGQSITVTNTGNDYTMWIVIAAAVIIIIVVAVFVVRKYVTINL
jgi:hypothetical protein